MFISLPIETREALTRLAIRERRDARDQAAVLIELALKLEGALRDTESDSQKAESIHA